MSKEKSTIECLLDLLPCYNKNQYYKGKYNIINNNDKGKKCSECEYIQALRFIINELKGYELEKCCDLEDSSKKKPDMLFVNKSNNQDRIVIEVKRLKHINSNNQERSQKITARKKRIEKILNEVYKEINIQYKNKSLGSSIIDKMFQDIINSITVLFYNKAREIAYISIYDKIGQNYKGHKEKNFIKDISFQVLEFIMINLLAIINSDKKSFIVEKDFCIDDIGFYVVFNNMDGFKGTYIERNLLNFPSEHIKLKINEFYNDCKEKFVDYNKEKRILLIKNETEYYEDEIIKIINTIEKPDSIDEVWLEYIEYEEIYNEDIDDWEEVIKERKCIKL